MEQQERHALCLIVLEVSPAWWRTPRTRREMLKQKAKVHIILR